MLESISNFISGIVEGRDPVLNEHHQRVAVGISEFAEYIGCTEEERQILSIGASIHDLGKLSINEHILNKPARLTATEMELVRQHPELGYQLLAPLNLDTRVTGIVRYHHENFDGTGYPEKLKGDRIPFYARIMRLWDVYDAVTMDRPYHKGVSSSEALQILVDTSERYDPELLASFCHFIEGRFGGRVSFCQGGEAVCLHAPAL